MAGSLNKVILIGNLGKDPEIKSFSNGGEVCNFSIATSESWKDKNSGERKEKTEWHNISVFSPGLINVCKSYLKKGSKVYIEGSLETRSWEQDGQKKYTTDIVLKGFDAKMLMLDGRGQSSEGGYNDNQDSYSQQSSAPLAGSRSNAAPAPVDELEDEIPF